MRTAAPWRRAAVLVPTLVTAGDIPAHDPGGDQCFLSVAYEFKVVGEGGDNDP